MKRKYDIGVQELIDIYLNTEMRWAASRTKSLECYGFTMNKQWTDKEIKNFLKDNRVPMVYNLILPRLHNLIGTEQLNRRSARIRPSSSATRPQADILNGLMNSIWEKEEGEFEFEKMFIDGLICTIPGWMGVYVEPDEIGQLEYRLRSLNPFSVYPDPDYRDYKLRDCKWIMVEQWMNIDEIKESFGDKLDLKGETSAWWERLSARLSGLMGNGDNDSKFFNQNGDLYKVIEMQSRETQKREVFADLTTGQYLSLTMEEAKEMQGNTNFIYVTETRAKQVHIKTVIPHFNAIVVDEPYFIKTDKYNLIPYTSFDYNNLKSENNSLVNALIDPQKNLNKREIQKTTFIDHTINSPVLFSYEDKDAKEEFESKGNKPGLGLLYRNQKNPPKRLQPGQVTNDIWNDIADSIDKMNDISGINETARGQSEYSGESARLFNMKAERTGATVNPYFRNLSKSRKMWAEYFLSTVKQVYKEEGRIAEIVDITGRAEEVVLNTMNGINIATFEGKVVLDDAEYSPTRLQENMQTKLVLAQSMPPEYVNWTWILKDLELPDVEEQIEYIQMITGQMQEQQAMQTAMAEDQAITQQLLAEKQLKEPAEKSQTSKPKSKEKKK